MIAYKGTKNGKCFNLNYKIGKIHELTQGELELCETGFHF